MMNVYLSQFCIDTPEGSAREFLYFPYSVGVIWSYALTKPKIRQNMKLKEFLIKKENIQDVVDGLDNPAIFGFNSVVWNHEYNLKLAQCVKERYPNCVIIFGGASVKYQDEQFLRQYKFIDYAIYREGEIAFSNLLLHTLGEDLDNSGIGYIKDGKFITAPATRMADIDDIPSPYTTGLFDYLVEKYEGTNVVLNAVVETNRGCPFGCTFCDWGNGAFGKIKKGGMHRVKGDFEWLAKKKIEYITNADANFGIFKDRDVEITKYMIELKNKYNYPQIFNTSWNKVFSVQMVEIAKMLSEAGMMRRFMGSFQSLNELTNKSIKRKNISMDNFFQVYEACKKNNITISTEFMLPLPEETYDSFMDTLERFYEADINTVVNILSILPNSEMNDPEYRKKYGLITQMSPVKDSPYATEYHEMVIGTNTMSVEEFEKANIIRFLLEVLHAAGFCDIISRFIAKQKMCKTTKIYEDLYEYFLLRPDSVLYKHFIILVGNVKKQFVQKMQGTQIKWPMFSDIGDKNRKKLYRELKEFVSSYGFPENICNDVILLQNSKQKHFGQEENYDITTSCNIYEYLVNDEPLEDGKNVYNISNGGVDKKHKVYSDFMISCRFNQNWQTKVKNKSYLTEKLVPQPQLECALGLS